ncbi:MAG: glutamate--tRNA ligase family protein [Myxococcota bacterium]
MSPVGRLAPTPSGDLHLGNALAFGAAWLAVRREGGRLLLRIEDLDRGRSRPAIAERQREDLHWLGIDWDEEVAAQSTRTYPLDGLPVYRCGCSRKKRLAGECACRVDSPAEGVWRFACPPEPVTFVDALRGPHTLPPGRDPIVRRRDGEAAYPLAVVLDDHRDGVTQVVRGADLIPATPVQIRIAEALGIPRPRYQHVPVLLGPDGRKLSKSHQSTELRALRDAGWTPERVWAALMPCLGLPPKPLWDISKREWTEKKTPKGPFTFGEDGRRMA